MAEIVDVLQSAATLRLSGSRHLWTTYLSEELDVFVEPLTGEALRPWLLNLVERCAHLPDGLPCLARALRYVEQESTAVTALWRLLEEWEASAFFSGVDLRRLRPALESVGPPGLNALARRASRSRVQELPSWCDSGWQVFLRLAGENSAQGEASPSLAFLALIADQLAMDGRIEEAEELRRWRRSRQYEWGLDTQTDDWDPSLVPAYLIIQFEPDGLDPERYYLSHWHQSDSAGWHPVQGETRHLHRDELPVEVERLIERTEERWVDLTQPIVLEFILPWELLNEPVEWWHKESSSSLPTPLVMDYMVLLRSLDRLRRTAWHRPWRNKWRRLSEQPADSHSYWSRPADGPSYYFHLERELKEDQHAVCLILSAPPGGAEEADRQEFLVGLRSGVPLMIWHRRDCADPAFKEAVSEMVQDRGLASLADRVARLRTEALALGPGRWEAHVGRHLAILLDDPEHQPGLQRSHHAP
ncbi:hypothetical protein ASD48_25890 [Streptomyces sp. Root1310]|nr:hypothetical protein ASD48_25890 [Streptomyces sp. Root1310]